MTTPSQSTAYKRDLPGVVAAMMRPEIYRDHPRSIESRQTHISYVFLAGD
jgi:aminoglycoside phosphotransferase family enzyme